MRKKYIILITIIIAAGAGVWYYFNSKTGGVSEFPKRYEDQELGFSVDYPEGFTVNSTEEDNVKILVFSKKDSTPPAGEVGESFQIFIMPYDEPGPITPERILIDAPDIVMKDPQTVKIAGEEALVFFSTDPDIGGVREVWFVHSGRLYQASTYAKYDELLAKIMKTFKFK